MLFPCVCVPQEMYPPKVHQFAYVTDEACTEDEILSMEIIIMKVKKQQLLIVPWHISKCWFAFVCVSYAQPTPVPGFDETWCWLALSYWKH